VGQLISIALFQAGSMFPRSTSNWRCDCFSAARACLSRFTWDRAAPRAASRSPKTPTMRTTKLGKRSWCARHVARRRTDDLRGDASRPKVRP